jgi:hypothetical protein
MYDVLAYSCLRLLPEEADNKNLLSSVAASANKAMARKA